MMDNSKRTGAAIEAHYQFLTWLAPTVQKLPRSHKFTIGDRIQNTAFDVLEAVIEATYTRERMQHLSYANLGIEKLRFLLRLAADLRLLDRRRYEHAARTLDETGRLIGGWMKAHSASGSEAVGGKNASHENLFGRIANFQALHAAARRAVKGKRKKPAAAAFFANLESDFSRWNDSFAKANIGLGAT
jgi:hypothetical protein